MRIKQKLMITGLVFGYLCMFMLIQEMRSDHIRNLGVGDGVYERMDAICSQVGDKTGSVVTESQRDSYKSSMSEIRSIIILLKKIFQACTIPKII